MSQQHSNALTATKDYLQASVCRAPLTDGAKVLPLHSLHSPFIFVKVISGMNPFVNRSTGRSPSFLIVSALCYRIGFDDQNHNEQNLSHCKYCSSNPRCKLINTICYGNLCKWNECRKHQHSFWSSSRL